MKRLLAGAALLLWPGPAVAQQPLPLFDSDSLLQLAIQGPLQAIASDRENEAGRPGTLTHGSDQLRVGLAPRGITRRSADICDFPPIRVDFSSPPAGSLFAGQRRLKLVTHCRKAEPHQQHVLLEYAAYRMFNLLTPLSFRARLARIDYRDGAGRPMAVRYGFFIEDLDDVGRRTGTVRMRAGNRIPIASLSKRETALAAMFEYMIGNLDWSLRAGPEGDGCCHNSRLLARPGSAAALPVPYDFDFSGFVDVPYATPPPEFNVRSVRVRKYRGYCVHNSEALMAAREIRAKQGELTAAIASVPGLSAQSAGKAVAYLQPFFAQIADDETVRARILKECVR